MRSSDGAANAGDYTDVPPDRQAGHHDAVAGCVPGRHCVPEQPLRVRDALRPAGAHRRRPGLPVASTAVGDIPGVVQDGVSGRLAPPRDAGELAAAIESCLADPATGRAMGARGRDTVAREYSIAAMAARLEELYTSAVRGGRR